MKKLMSIMLVLIMCVCLLAACGGKAPHATESAPQQVTEPQATESALQQETETQTAEPIPEQETEPQVVKTFELADEQIIAENVSPYEGIYLEYGDQELVSGLYAMKFTNTGNQTIQDAQMIFSDGTQELSFWLEMLPAGQSVVAAERNQLTAATEALNYVDSTINYLEEGLEKDDCVKVTDNQNGTVKVENLTGEMLPLVRVFFRPTDANGNPIGGPCKSILVDGIEAGAAVDVEAEGWDETCVVVTVLVINE